MKHRFHHVAGSVTYHLWYWPWSSQQGCVCQVFIHWKVALFSLSYHLFFFLMLLHLLIFFILLFSALLNSLHLLWYSYSWIFTTKFNAFYFSFLSLFPLVDHHLDWNGFSSHTKFSLYLLLSFISYFPFKWLSLKILALSLQILPHILCSYSRNFWWEFC